MESFAKLVSSLPEETRGVVVTVLATGGSTPRKAGARMFVSQSGREFGTIGGGWIEHEAITVAKEMLENDLKTTQRSFNLGGPSTNTPMLCGGKVTLFFQQL